jgi:hypothetical protein
MFKNYDSHTPPPPPERQKSSATISRRQRRVERGREGTYDQPSAVLRTQISPHQYGIGRSNNIARKHATGPVLRHDERRSRNPIKNRITQTHQGIYGPHQAVEIYAMHKTNAVMGMRAPYVSHGSDEARMVAQRPTTFVVSTPICTCMEVLGRTQILRMIARPDQTAVTGYDRCHISLRRLQSSEQEKLWVHWQSWLSLCPYAWCVCNSAEANLIVNRRSNEEC